MQISLCGEAAGGELSRARGRFISVKETQINISLVDVTEVPPGCRLHRWELLRFAQAREDACACVRLKARVTSDASRGWLILHLSVEYSWERGMLRRRLLDFETETRFEVEDFEGHFGRGPRHPEVVDMPPSVLRLMLCTGIGTLRGMLAVHTQGTPLARRPLPLIDVSLLLSRLIYGDTPRDAEVYPLTGLAGA